MPCEYLPLCYSSLYFHISPRVCHMFFALLLFIITVMLYIKINAFLLKMYFIIMDDHFRCFVNAECKIKQFTLKNTMHGLMDTCICLSHIWSFIYYSNANKDIPSCSDLSHYKTFFYLPMTSLSLFGFSEVTFNY